MDIANVTSENSAAAKKRFRPLPGENQQHRSSTKAIMDA